MSNFFVAIAVFLITVIGALFAIPYLIDWNGYRGVFEEEATRLLGREVRVGGAVNLHLLPTPYFRFEKVRIADTSTTLQDAFFRAESLAVKLAIPPIFRGQVEANEIELKRPVLRLALDKSDGWNWQSFGQALGRAAYMPSNIALTSVKVTDGLVALHGADGTERTQFEAVNGELSAPALDGPYRFRGTLGKAAAERELRLSTARPEPDGTVRFKASMRSADGASTYSLEGRLVDLGGKPRIDGALTARLPAASLWRTSLPGAAAAPRRPGSEQGAEVAFDLRANVAIDPAGATLSDLALAFEQNGRPQLITGEAKALWRQGLALDLNLASRWLDLDRIAGVEEAGASPLDSLVPIAIAMRNLLPAGGQSRATFTVDQGNVGREAVSNLRLALARNEERLELEQLHLGMPGGSRGELSGSISGPAEALAFEGDLSLRGTSLARFLGWAAGATLPVDAKSDGTFGMRARLSVAPGRVGARNLVADLSGTTLRGDVQYRWEGKPELSLALESPLLDARSFIPAGASLADVLGLMLHGGAAGQDPANGSKAGWRGAGTDARIRVNAGRLMTALRTYRDVMVDMELKGGRLSVPLLRVSGDHGLSLEVEGTVEDAAARPKGTLRAVAVAETARAVEPLAELLGIPEALRPGPRRTLAMVPLRMAGTVVLGARTPTSADLTLDGEASGAGVKLKARFDGSQGGWRTGPADVTGVIEGTDAGTISTLLAPGIYGGKPMPGRVLVKAGGVPAQGLASLVTVDAGDLALGFRGKVVLADTGNSADGELEIRSADGARLAALADLAPPLRLDGVPVSGALSLSVGAGKLAADKLRLKVAGGDVRGKIALEPAGDRRRVEAALELEEIAVAKLVAPLLDQQLAVAAAAETAVSGRASPWPDETFDASVLDAFEGSIRIAAGRLLVADGLALRKANVDIALSPGRVDVRKVEGACIGGRCSAALRLDKVPAGVELTGSLRLEGAKLDAVAGGGKTRAGGTAGGEITFTGKGTSPRAVLSVLQGSGTLRLADAKVAAAWPGAIAVAVEAALKSEPDKLAAVVKQRLAAALSEGELPLPASIAVKIADGQLTVPPLTIDTAVGRAQGGASLDLRSLTLDSEWRIDQALAAAVDKPPLPNVSVAYRGPVASAGSLEPRIGSDALERELAVRRMERDVEELERLRRLDEKRRLEEAERQRRQFEQTPVPAPVPPAPVPVAPVLPQPRPAAPG